MPSSYDNFQLAQAPIIQQYHGAPVEEFGKLVEAREKAYQDNVAALDQLDIAAANLSVNDADYELKKAKLDEIRQGIQTIADEGGAYEFAGEKVRHMARNFMSDQALKAAVENQKTIQEEREKAEELYRDGKISKNAYAESLKRLNAYEGVGEGAEGIYNKPDVYQAVNYVDVADELNKFGQGWKAEQRVTQNIDPSTGKLGLYSETTRQYIKPQEVRQGMMDRILSDPEMVEYINEEANLTGKTFEEVVNPMIEAQAAKLGFESSATQFKKIPGYNANTTSPASSGSEAVYNQSTGAGENEVLKGGSAAVEAHKKELGEALSKIQEDRGKLSNMDRNSQAYKVASARLAEQEKSILEDQAQYAELENRLREQLVKKYGRDFEEITPEVEQEVYDELVAQYRNSKATGGAHGVTVPVIDESSEEFKQYMIENRDRILTGIDPMHGEYNDLLIQAGTSDSFDSPVFMADETPARKNLDDIIRRSAILPTKDDVILGKDASGNIPIGFFEASGPNQGAQVTADMYPNINRMEYGGDGVDKNGNPIVYLNMYGKDNESLGKVYTTDTRMTTNALRRLTPTQARELSLNSKVLQVSKKPLKSGNLGSINDTNGVKLDVHLDVITSVTASEEDKLTGSKYKVTITNPATKEVKEQYYNSVVEMNQDFKDANLIF